MNTQVQIVWTHHDVESCTYTKFVSEGDQPTTKYQLEIQTYKTGTEGDEQKICMDKSETFPDAIIGSSTSPIIKRIWVKPWQPD